MLVIINFFLLLTCKFLTANSSILVFNTTTTQVLLEGKWVTIGQKLPLGRRAFIEDFTI